MFWGRPPGGIQQNLGQEFPDQDQNLAPVMLPGVPAREIQPENMIDDVNAEQENHEGVELDQLQTLQNMMDGNDEDMLQSENQHQPNQQPLELQDQQQVMSPRERFRQHRVQANALQDRPNAFDQANAHVVMQRQRQENNRICLEGSSCNRTKFYSRRLRHRTST